MATSIKISQLPAKGANLEATDLLEVSEFNGTGYVSKSITGAEIIASVPPTTVDWGDIGGTLSSQTDLNTALSGKQDDITLTTTGTSGASTFVANTLNVPAYSLSGLGGVPTTRTLTINGTTQDLSADRTFTISTGITIGTTAITSGTVGRVLFEGTGNVVSESANLFWDNTNGRLGIGTSSPSAIIHSVGSVTAFGATARGNYFNNTLVASANGDILSGLDINPTFTNGAFTGVTNYALRLSTGGFLVGADFTQSSSAYKISGSDATLALRNTSSGGYSGVNMYDNANTLTGTFQIGGTAVGSPFQNNMFIGARQSAGKLIFVRGTSATESMTLFSTGNVAINTTTDAGYKLDVNGTARVQGQITTTTANAQFGTIGASTGNFRIDGVNGAGYAFAVYSSSTLRFGVVGYGGIDMPNGFSVVSGSTDLTTTRLRIGTGNTTAAINIQAQTLNTDIVSFKASNGVDQFTIKNTSGNILVGTSTDVPSSKLTIQSTTQGFLPPRMDTTQKNAIATPATGLMVYDTTLNLISVYNGTTWITL